MTTAILVDDEGKILHRDRQGVFHFLLPYEKRDLSCRATDVASPGWDEVYVFDSVKAAQRSQKRWQKWWSRANLKILFSYRGYPSTKVAVVT